MLAPPYLRFETLEIINAPGYTGAINETIAVGRAAGQTTFRTSWSVHANAGPAQAIILDLTGRRPAAHKKAHFTECRH